MAVGDTLTVPESGWNRFDDKNILIKYESKDWYDWAFSKAVGGIYIRAKSNASVLRFFFKGTGLRLISPTNVDLAKKMQIKINDTTYDYSLYSSSLKTYTVTFEITGLPNKNHAVEISIPSENAGGVLFDALDIQSGVLVEYALQNKFLLLSKEKLYTINSEKELFFLANDYSVLTNDFFEKNGFETFTKENCEIIAQELGECKILRAKI